MRTVVIVVDRVTVFFPISIFTLCSSVVFPEYPEIYSRTQKSIKNVFMKLTFPKYGPFDMETTPKKF